MSYTFKAKIYQVGINWCVDVPEKITTKMNAVSGRIKIKGTINGYGFTKTLMPVKDGPHRLFVNLQMMKGGLTSLGKTALFVIKEDNTISKQVYQIPSLLKAELQKSNLTVAFEKLTASRKKDILKYLSYIKREETMVRNIDKLLAQLKAEKTDVRIP